MKATPACTICCSCTRSWSVPLHDIQQLLQEAAECWMGFSMTWDGPGVQYILHQCQAAALPEGLQACCAAGHRWSHGGRLSATTLPLIAPIPRCCSSCPQPLLPSYLGGEGDVAKRHWAVVDQPQSYASWVHPTHHWHCCAW